ncbi:hypothetical protein DF186_17595, partial [Enterococcus hirae]
EPGGQRAARRRVAQALDALVGLAEQKRRAAPGGCQRPPAQRRDQHQGRQHDCRIFGQAFHSNLVPMVK